MHCSSVSPVSQFSALGFDETMRGEVGEADDGLGVEVRANCEG